MREIDLLHQPDDQHEAERDEREQEPERQAVDEMRQQIEQHDEPAKKCAGPDAPVRHMLTPDQSS